MQYEAASSFINGFPAQPSDPDYSIQVVIDGELRNCHALAGTPKATNGMLYPAYFAVPREERANWLEPALRRWEWVKGKEPWETYFRGFLNLLVSAQKPPAPDSVLLRLAQFGPELDNGHRINVWVTDAVAASLKERKQPLSAELVAALKKLTDHMLGRPNSWQATLDIAWRLWRAPENPDDGAPCFSARVRADLRGMPEAEAAAWAHFLDLRALDLSLLTNRCAGKTAIDGPRRAKLRRILTEIGQDQFVYRWTGWLEAMPADQPAPLSAAGGQLLALFSRVCAAEPGLPLDAALYVLCGVQWAGAGNRFHTSRWVAPLLLSLAVRPPVQALTCAERLAQNPETARFAGVQSLHKQLLSEIAETVSPPVVREGVDKYDLMCEPELYRQQVILDRCMHDAAASTRPNRGEFLMDAVDLLPLLVLRQAKSEKEKFVRAAASRAQWVNENTTPFDEIVLEPPRRKIGARRANASLHWRSVLKQIHDALLEAEE